MDTKSSPTTQSTRGLEAAIANPRLQEAIQTVQAAIDTLVYTARGEPFDAIAFLEGQLERVRPKEDLTVTLDYPNKSPRKEQSQNQ